MRKLTATWVLAAAVSFGGELTGWISDATCGAANAKADSGSRECAKSCIKGGAAPVFVSDQGGKVYKLAGKVEEAKAHLDYKVKVRGEVKGDTFVIDGIGKAE
jgi:hypothetical protein